MNNEWILKTDLLDILFINRNKGYGAYLLRKGYDKRLTKSVISMLMAVLVFVAFTMLPEGKIPPAFTVTEMGFAKLPIAPKPPAIKPPLVKRSINKLVPTVKLTSKIVIVNKDESADTLVDMKEMYIGSKTNFLPSAGTIETITTGGETGSPVVEESKTVAPVTDPAIPIANPDVMPEYPGGLTAFKKFLEKNLHNPRELESGEIVSVKMRVVIGQDGKLKNIDLQQAGATEFNEEVIRVLKKMPAWIPGKFKNQPVSVYYTIPVKFISED